VTRLKRYVSNSTVKRVDPDLPYVALEHIEPGTGGLLDGVILGGKIADDSVEHLPGDVRFGKLRPYLSKSFLAEDSGVGSGELLVLRPGPEIDPRFLWYLTLSPPFVEWATATSYGVKMPRTSWKELSAFDLDLPPLATQRQIVEFLDRELEQIDLLVNEQRRLISLARERTGVVLNRLATHGVGSPPLRESGQPWLGEIPSHWEVAKLKHVARLESGHTPSRTQPELWTDCHIPWISLNDVGAMATREFISETTNLISEKGIAASSARLLPAGTVVLSRDATIGRSSIMGVDMATSQHFADWVCSARLLPRYLWLLFTTSMQSHFNSLTDGATLRTIGMPDLRALTIPLPPVEEQEQIVEAAAEARSEAQELYEELEQQMALLRERRKVVIADAVTGLVEVA
jgi:type I restriction enzyme S subunit